MRFLPAPKDERVAGGSTGATGCTRAQGRRSQLPRHLAANNIPLLRKPRGPTSLTDSIDDSARSNGETADEANLAATAAKRDDIEVRQISIGGQGLQVAIRRGTDSKPPLLLFNGIGANWELAKPFLQALKDTTAIVFDVPGVGGSPAPSLPYRPRTLARLAAGLVAELGYSEIDVAGVSWGGGIAQQFAYQFPKTCRRLVLAATAPGAIMVPAGPSVLWKMATPRRYTDKDYLSKVAPEIYGGSFRTNPSLIAQHASAMRGAGKLGYLYQLLAMTGWTSLPWLWLLPQPTLILMGSDDPLVPEINGHILGLLIPKAQLRIIDDGHLFMVTRPAEVAAIIEEFLADQDASPEPKASMLSRKAPQVPSQR
jgi:poly(3-hydroxyalkanoate) depolymerase